MNQNQLCNCNVRDVDAVMLTSDSLLWCQYLSDMQVKVVTITGVQLDAGKVEFVTNVPALKTRSQPVIRVLMSNGPRIAGLHGMHKCPVFGIFLVIYAAFYEFYHVRWTDVVQPLDCMENVIFCDLYRVSFFQISLCH